MCPHVCYIWEQPGAWRWLVGGERCDLTVKGKTMIFFFFFFFFCAQLFPAAHIFAKFIHKIHNNTFPLWYKAQDRVPSWILRERWGLSQRKEKRIFFLSPCFFSHTTFTPPHSKDPPCRVLHYIKAQGCGVVCLTWKYLNFLFIIFPFL